MPQKFWIFLALAVTGAAWPALAQDADDERDEIVASEEHVTVYGTRNPMEAFSYPGMVTVIGQEEIETINPSSIADTLRDVPGVEFSGGPRRTPEIPSIRGMNGLRTLILLDGTRQDFTSGHDGRFFFDPALLKSVEVVRGPASALYGSGALGGVLAFTTVDASDLLEEGETAGVRLRAGYQSVNEEYLAGVTGFAAMGEAEILASIGHRESGDIRLGSGADLQADDDILMGLVKFGWHPSESFDARISYSSFANDPFEPSNFTGAPVNKEVRSSTLAGNFRFTPQSAEFIDMKIIPYMSISHLQETDPGTGDRSQRDLDTFGVDIDNRTTLAEDEIWKVLLTVGGEWSHGEQEGHNFIGFGGIPQGESNFAGAFAQIEATMQRPFGLPGELIVIPGVRFDSFSTQSPGNADTEDDAVSPKVAVSFAPVDWLLVFGSWAEAFRAPSYNELYLTGVHFAIPLGPASWVNTFVPNPDLTPETSNTWEFGAGVRFDNMFADGDNFHVKASHYESRVDDLINLSVNFAPFPPATCFFPPFTPCSAGTTTADNVADAELDGFELEGGYENEAFVLSVAYSTINGRDRATGEYLGVLTPDRLALDGAFKLPDFDSRIGARVQVADDFDKVNAPAEARDGYTVVDVYAAFEPQDGPLVGLRIDVGVDNVADEDYERVFAGVSEPGRNFKATVAYRVGW